MERSTVLPNNLYSMANAEKKEDLKGVVERRCVAGNSESVQRSLNSSILQEKERRNFRRNTAGEYSVGAAKK